MTRYISLANRLRPTHFSELIGHRNAIAPLEAALQQGKLHHSLIFTGTRGVGKTTLARIVARAINCAEGVSSIPCDECSPCKMALANNLPDLIEIDAASNTKVEQIRDIIDSLKYMPVTANNKILIIDEVHMLSNHSFNALLKILEEPPTHVKFILATTELNKIPETILSRSLVYHLTSLSNADLESGLEKALISLGASKVDPEVVKLIAISAHGSMRDAYMLLEQISSGVDLATFNAEQVASKLSLPTVSSVCQLFKDLELSNSDAVFAFWQQYKNYDFDRIIILILSILHEIIIAKSVNAYKPALLSSEQIAELANMELTYCQKLYDTIYQDHIKNFNNNLHNSIAMQVLLQHLLSFTHVQVVEKPTKVPKVTVKLEKPAPVENVPEKKPIPDFAVETPIGTSEQPITEHNWFGLINELSNISGTAKEVLNQSEFIAFDGKELQLGFTKQIFQIYLQGALKTKIETSIKSSLSSKLGFTISLRCKLLESVLNNLDSNNKKLQDEKQEKDLQALKNDPNIQLLKDQIKSLKLEKQS